jgi:hypothetical protein
LNPFVVASVALNLFAAAWELLKNRQIIWAWYWLSAASINVTVLLRSMKNE